MSNVNIRRAVDNIRANTTVYTPVVETIVNAIQAIDECGQTVGRVQVRALRSAQNELDGGRAAINGFTIRDNGIGFTDEHRNAFDTLYTDHRVAEGGKGFGRFICLKYFEDLRIDSVYQEGEGFRSRSFAMGKDHDIVAGEEVGETGTTASGTVASLVGLKIGRGFDKKLSTIARNLVERLLPYFITEGYRCPEIVLAESDGRETICLNDFVANEVSSFIQEIRVRPNMFDLDAKGIAETFAVRVFKIFSLRAQKSRISLVAHKREVSGSPLDRYVPEFAEEFYESGDRPDGQVDGQSNYIVKAYALGPYLDRNVSLERGGFEFNMESELLLGIAQVQIERKVAEIAQGAVGHDIGLRRNRKRKRIQSYVDEEAPWHKEILAEVDLSDMPHNPTVVDMETRLQKEKLTRELVIKGDVARILSEESLADVKESVVDIVEKISGTSKNDLIHYIALRRQILEIFKRSLELDESGDYSFEGVVHDIVFPRRGDTEVTSFHNHNLWIVDERLNFTNYVSSDVPLDAKTGERPDLLVYNKRVLFRGDNEASNPITIFEFKRPQRDDFANPSSAEDPVQQIVRYVNRIRDGEYKTPEGRKMLVAENTPFYGFVVCDLTSKVEIWLQRGKGLQTHAGPPGVVPVDRQHQPIH